MTQYITRLRGEKCKLEDSLIEEGSGDGAAYGKYATYRELRLIEKLVSSLGVNFSHYGIDANTLACAACDVDEADMETNEWIETNLAKRWCDEEPYIRGFIYGALEILEEIDSVES